MTVSIVHFLNQKKLFSVSIKEEYVISTSQLDSLVGPGTKKRKNKFIVEKILNYKYDPKSKQIVFHGKKEILIET